MEIGWAKAHPTITIKGVLMIACMRCKIELTCVKNGVGLVFGTTHVYSGDLFRCKTCGIEVVDTGNSLPYHSEKALEREFNIQMTEGP